MATAIKNAAAPASKPRGAKTAPATAKALAPTSITTIPYGRLRRAPQNVRKTDIAADVESLADDIAAHGLLQSLIGYAGSTTIDAKAVYVVGGGRRLQALQLLRERGTIKDNWPVPVLIRPEDEAVELSLSENLARRDMNPADEFVAFAALMAPGNRSPADLAKQFGFTERYVKQRLRLAGLAEEILDALRLGQISLEVATEYAKTADQALQSRVFKRECRPNNYQRHSLWNIRAAYSAEQMTEACSVFRFIDRDTYEREGGGYEEDLFTAAADGAPRKLANGQLARGIANRCLQLQAVRVQMQAQGKYPSVSGSVIPADLTVDGKAEAPTGYALIAGGWNGDLGMHVAIDDCWKRAMDRDVSIQIVVGVGQEEPIGEDDDGSALEYVAQWDRTRFFVPREHRKTVLPEKRETSYGGPQLTPEQEEEQAVAHLGRVWAARLAVPKFSDLPGMEGRAFYANDWLGEKTKPGDPHSGPRTPCFEIQMFVTEEEIASNLPAGIEHAREVIADRKRRKEEREAAATAAKVAEETRWQELCAADPAPEVLLTTGGDLWTKTPLGWTIEGQEEDVGYAEEFADLLEALNPADVGGWWATQADYQADHPDAAGDAEGGQ
ncbi:ParB/RepB/Spo0J family partition protein [Sphingomonas sp. RIT328]|uniref:ParB/RepB/Spo0J family partition protein n=1 Tax=Sphingomonas sp. RIT328 TaxID=1470591 RepID=UPI0004533F06|nr:ParB/RepB/Spo0J family partition protein [Sphingomonas sp. RIT328]EZP57460.1 ParB-like partition protein [Sphingomonas sp. RIT328]